MTLLSVKALESKIKKALQSISDGKTKQVNISCGANTILIVRQSAIVYYSRIKINGRQKMAKIADYEAITLAEARKAATAKIQTKDTDTPTAHSFKKVAEEWLKKKSTEGKNNSRYLNLKSLYKHLSGLYRTPLNEITIPKAIKAVSKIDTTERNKRHALTDVLNGVLNFAVIQGYIPANPCQNMAKIPEFPFKEPSSSGWNYCEPQELKKRFFSKLGGLHHQHKILTLFLCFSCSRITAGISLKWSWINNERQTIIFPAEIMKASKEFILPITPQIKSLLAKWRSLQEATGLLCDFVFPNYRQTAPAAKTDYQQAIREIFKGELHIHGLRKTARTFMAENKIQEKIAELCLAHDKRSALVKVYDRYEYLNEKLEALKAWNNYVQSQLTDDFSALI